MLRPPKSLEFGLFLDPFGAFKVSSGEFLGVPSPKLASSLDARFCFPYLPPILLASEGLLARSAASHHTTRNGLVHQCSVCLTASRIPV